MNTHRSFIIALFTALLALAFIGCASTSNPSTPVTPKQETIANAVEDTLSIGLVPVLAKNPSYIPTARSVAGALGAFTGDTITPGDVAAFLAKTNLAPEDRDAIAGMVNAAWAKYCKRYAQEVSGNIRPDVKLFLAAVKNGIESAVAALPQPSASVVLGTITTPTLTTQESTGIDAITAWALTNH